MECGRNIPYDVECSRNIPWSVECNRNIPWSAKGIFHFSSGRVMGMDGEGGVVRGCVRWQILQQELGTYQSVS